jgi:hypothetical protein
MLRETRWGFDIDSVVGDLSAVERGATRVSGRSKLG